ncbi:efflux RND transporter periplasmic adaptor subunit [Aneurinibacillus sp. Ricciae_BoGa-3]|uniref:efflux RND transporter periplasmic adaptor subunit n=1 Tax=Aneurinibacillus sp. Ricciae_BoGa-3 TaxID=3022697 RepID=UPI002341615B|nr:efflux RND transporter periplasmic adaptor subunit [Aneurinibacillus sp. Ricciae_BoGa-3]WCK55589.1 efflux RND transporter periplasmic adaptor subunit [Aneurinibacillus sp. Ricciae_BoGa-3]
MKHKRMAIVMTAALAGITGCGSSTAVERAAAAAGKEKKIVEVSTVHSEAGAQYTRLSGILQSSEETLASFEVGGRIVSTEAAIGDRVSQGTVLARLDSSDYELQSQKANSAIDTANAALQSAGASIQSAQATIDETANGAREQERAQAKLALDRANDAYLKADSDRKRAEALYRQGALSQKDYDDAVYKTSNAQKDLENARAAYSLVMEGTRPEKRRAIQAALVQAQAAQQQAQTGRDQAVLSSEQAQLTLAKTTLTSKIAGVIVDKQASVGQLITPGTPVYRIASIDPLKVLLPVPDSEIDNWHIGDAVTLTLYGKSRSAKVSKIYPSTNSSTGTINVEVHIPNPAGDWYAGQVVFAERKLKETKGIFLPVEAVISTGSHPYVFINNKGKAVQTPVTIGTLVNNKLEITSGLYDGASVVTKGADRLFNGDAIDARSSGGTQKP